MTARDEALRELAMTANGRSREDCVRSAVASVRIEGGDVSDRTQSLLAQWARGEIAEEAVMQAILAPTARPR